MKEELCEKPCQSGILHSWKSKQSVIFSGANPRLIQIEALCIYKGSLWQTPSCALYAP